MGLINMMQTSLVYVTSALEREDGQTFAEYALIFALVVIVAMAGLLALGPAILAQFTAVTAAL